MRGAPDHRIVARAETIVRRGDPDYPLLLEASPDPPEELHCLGDAGLLGRLGVAIVGSRKATVAGRTMAERLGAEIGGQGIVVISGCAVGIDAAAHEGALEFGGPTVAVLGGGLDVAVPKANRGLADRIAEAGCLVSEHPLGVPPLAHHFPWRNRIIAGLARIVVVVEAAAKSGALVTARLALAAGRDVMAVPGHPLFDNSAGVNGLLTDGARPVRSAQDVLDELGKLPPAGERLPLTAAEDLESGDPRQRILEALSELPAPAERLAAATRLPLAETLVRLTELELVGMVRAHPGHRFSLPLTEKRSAGSDKRSTEKRSAPSGER